VFMDVESIDSGQFGAIILKQIAARAHFLVILTPGALDGVQEPDDWLRREIEHAIALGRNVVPILVNDYRFDDTVRAHLPETLRALPDYNGLPLYDTFFTEAMERLRTRFLEESVQRSITPAPPQDASVVQQIIAEAVRQAAQPLAPRITNSIGMEFVLIPAGTFLMGSNDGEIEEQTVHQVAISQPFYLGMYPVTQGQWEQVMRTKPSEFTGDGNRPVETVSWDDAQKFIQLLNAKEGGALYRLPTEAEWEYACRAGSTTAYSFGDDPSQLDAYGWYYRNAGGTTHPVGQRKPNDWGLYDMHGNVWEWVQDWYEAYTPEPVTDPHGPSWGSSQVIRGGSWGHDAESCRSAYRSDVAPGYRHLSLGFRLLRTAR
jgi:formylglycine-generating enzyme required for sulfatase activity